MTDDQTEVSEYAAHLESVLAEGGLSAEELAEIREVLARIEAKRGNSAENAVVDDTALSDNYHEPETTVVDRPTGAAAVHAWSETTVHHDEDEDVDDDYEPKLNRRHRELLKWLKPDDDVWNDEDDTHYTRGTVIMFVSLMAVAVIGAVYMLNLWVTDHRLKEEAAKGLINPTTPTWVAPSEAAAAPSTTTEAPAPVAAAPSTTSGREVYPQPVPGGLTPQDGKFLIFLRHNDSGGKYANVSDATLIRSAHMICQDMQNGVNFDNVAINLDLSNGGVAWFADTASANYCPKYGGNN